MESSNASSTDSTLPAWVAAANKQDLRVQPWKKIINAELSPDYSVGEDILDLEALDPDKKAVAAASQGTLAA
ncbi:hypothetical protein B7494_g2567 [Chlorociboria aeruginascens]|nr:hypothetical protein B7494_g2567 [Chlorociboria aeruginascens]